MSRNAKFGGELLKIAENIARREFANFVIFILREKDFFI